MAHSLGDLRCRNRRWRSRWCSLATNRQRCDSCPLQCECVQHAVVKHSVQLGFRPSSNARSVAVPMISCDVASNTLRCQGASGGCTWTSNCNLRTLSRILFVLCSPSVLNRINSTRLRCIIYPHRFAYFAPFGGNVTPVSV